MDVVAASLATIPRGGAPAFGLAFAAGLATSIGPCIAPRYVAVATLADRGRAGWTTAAFVTGLVAAYDTLGFAAGWLGSLFDLSFAIYTLLAAAMIAGGLWTLITARAGRHAHAARHPASLGAAFLLGAGSAFVVSPCCTPIVAAIVGASTAIGRPAVGIALLTAFALGHAAPLVLAGAAGARFNRALSRLTVSQAPAIVAGSLMLALGAYYGIVA